MKIYHAFAAVVAISCATMGCSTIEGACNGEEGGGGATGGKIQPAHATDMASYIHDDKDAPETVIATFEGQDFSTASDVFVDIAAPAGSTVLVTFTGNATGEWVYRAALRVYASIDGGPAVPVPGAQSYLDEMPEGGSVPVFIQGVIAAEGKIHIGIEGKVFAGDGMDLFGSAALVAQVFVKE